VDALWFAPPAVLIAGAAMAAVVLRKLAQAADDVAAARRRAGRLEDALIPLRVDARRAARRLDRHDLR